MTLQDQVCSLEQAKRLRELGVSNYGLFIHIENTILASDCQIKFYKETTSYRDFGKVENSGIIKYYAAFTVAELGVMLPDQSGIMAFSSYYNDHIGLWYCDLRDLVKWTGKGIPPLAHEEEGDTEAEARAAMLIHVLENKLATAEQINSQLNA